MTAPSNTRAALADALCRVLADTAATYGMAHGFHWNVRGPNFHSLHALFMEQYTELWMAMDVLAERIRALGALAPGGYGAMAALSSIREGAGDLGAEQMVETLLAAHESVLATLRTAMQQAEEAGDQASLDVLTPRLTASEKHAWMLRATLGRV